MLRMRGKRTPASARTKRPAPSWRPALEVLEDRCVPTANFIQTNLVSDVQGLALRFDPNLVNPWGVSEGARGPFWVSDNGTGVSTLYNAPGTDGSAITVNPLVVTIPGGAPTGQVNNPTTDFVVKSGTASAPAVFIFASESGAVTGWNPNVPPPAPSHNAQLGFQATDGAIYKGIAIASSGGANFLFLADFHNGKIDVLDGQFHLTHLAGNFTDPNLPKGYAPFNIRELGGKLYVTYARQDADREDDVPGGGHGFVDVFNNDGTFGGRLVSREHLDSPWGLAQAPDGFGGLHATSPGGFVLLVGNFGDGRIHAFDSNTGHFLGTLRDAHNEPLHIPGLWSLQFGNGAGGGDANTLYFTAGLAGEHHGLFGSLTPTTAKRGHGFDFGDVSKFLVHGDEHRALQVLTKVRDALESAGVDNGPQTAGLARLEDVIEAIIADAPQSRSDLKSELELLDALFADPSVFANG